VAERGTIITDKKILLVDIEWRPTKAYVWQPWKENITPEKIIEHGGLLCVGAKWYGEKETYIFAEWALGHEEMLRHTYNMLVEADAVITYNGDKYDLPKLAGEFLLYNIGPMPPLTSIDCLKAVKKFGFFMNRLAFVGPFLNLGSKLEHEGMKLWTKVIDGDAKAQARMAKYCAQDVKLLERLYRMINPYIKNHPHIGSDNPLLCPNCGSHEIQNRGFRRTKTFKIQRRQCTSCGAWHDGTRTKI